MSERELYAFTLYCQWCTMGPPPVVQPMMPDAWKADANSYRRWMQIASLVDAAAEIL